ncbi:MAG TPA: AEC family transporter [Candidatus Nanoarchaeia archaeon]|nr:AEC family transporter [Candidatus Nanoarchaeia archaeon]
MLEILSTIAPVFLIIALGAVIRALRLADERWVDTLNKLGLYVAFPALIFSSLTSMDSAQQALDYRLFFINAGILAAIMLLILIISWMGGIRAQLRNTYLLCAIFGNVAYIGLPYISSALPGSEGNVSLIAASYLAIVFTLGLIILEVSIKGNRHAMKVLEHILKNPLLIAVILGLLVAQYRIPLPVFFTSTVKMLAVGASPLVLLALGIFLVKKLRFDRDMAHAAFMTALKLAALPFLFILVSRSLLGEISFTIPIIEAGMPVAVTVFALSEKYPLEKTMIMYAIIISTVLSAITLPLLTWVVG